MMGANLQWITSLGYFGCKVEEETLSADLYYRLFAYFPGHVRNRLGFIGVRRRRWNYPKLSGLFQV